MGKIPTYKKDRFGSEPKQAYDDNAATMTEYHKKLILRLAELYSGAELEKRLEALKFCSLETAKEVIKNAGK